MGEALAQSGSGTDSVGTEAEAGVQESHLRVLEKGQGGPQDVKEKWLVCAQVGGSMHCFASGCAS